MHFNLANCVLYPILEAILTAKLSSYLFPASGSNGDVVYTLTAHVVFFTLLNNSILLFYNLLLYPFFLSPLRNLPKAKGFIPLIGHAWMRLRQPTGQAFLDTIKTIPNDGLILSRGIFHTANLIVTSTEALADVLVHRHHDFEKPLFTRTILKRFIGDSVITAEGEEHRHLRKIMTPAFHFRNIKDLYPMFWAKSTELCRTLNKDLGGRPDQVLEIGHYSTQVTMDIIGLAGLGRDIDSLHHSDDELVKMYEDIFEPTKEKLLYFICQISLSPWVIDKLPWGLNERLKVLMTRLKRLCSDFVAEKKAKLKLESAGSQGSRDIMSCIMRSHELPDENLVDHLLTILAAGHETTSATLTWSSYLLSKHPDIQSHLRLEIHEYIPDPKVLVDSAFDVAGLLESMPYLNGVCNEVLRFFPTVPVTTRVAIRDTTVAGHHIPAGTMICLVPWAINRLSTMWGPDAEEFVPERWIDEETGRPTMMGGAESNYSFLTFSHGPRNCVGERFARAGLRSLVAALVGSFTMELADPLEQVVVGGTVTSKPINGMRLKLQPVRWGSG